ncbi:MAG: hypothetical protein LBJ12_05930 [Oscillospiraceae bacterium]|jgi:hypothetical protein|nr:hypothetical protein [Oscillospiraceae bacterium]
MNKKLFLAIACPIWAIAIVATSFWILWNNKAQTPVVEPETAAQNEAQAESVFPVIAQEQIFAISETHFDWVSDPKDTEKTLNAVESVVRAKVLSADPASFLRPTAGSPYTPLNVQVLEVMSGDLELGSQTLYFPGGSVTAEQYLEANPTSGQKIGLEDMTQNERQKYYLDFPSEMDCDLNKNTEYVFLLVEDERVPNGYFIFTGGYSIFTTDKKNVKTGNELKSTKASKAKVAASTPAE